MDLRLRVLGPVRAWRGGHEVALGPPKQRAVLAVLVSRLNEIVELEQIVDGVWGGTAPLTAANGVHTYVAGLRRVLEPDRGRRGSGRLLVSAGGGYSLRIEEAAVDLAEFSARYARARERSAAEDLGGAIVELDCALALWRGRAYANVPGPHAELERTRLRELWLAVVELWAGTMLAAGRHDDVVATLHDVSVSEPLRERLRWLHMVALFRCDRQAHALAVYRETRRLLHDELGIEPGQDLRQLHARILAADPALSVPWPGGRPGSAAAS